MPTQDEGATKAPAAGREFAWLDGSALQFANQIIELTKYYAGRPVGFVLQLADGAETRILSNLPPRESQQLLTKAAERIAAPGDGDVHQFIPGDGPKH